MKINFINKGKLKRIAGVALVGSMLAAPVAGLAQNYTIQPGDTLRKISQQFYGRNDYYDEIAFLNNISDPSMIRAGDVIYLPDDARELEFCGQDDKWVENGILYYTFGKGDTLWGLANKYYGDGMYWKCLADYNNISNPKKIRDGKVIMVPPFAYLNMDALNYTFEGETNTNNNNQEEVKVRTHTFVEGDTLWALAKEYYGSGNYWEALAIYNNISNPKKISNGIVIELPHKAALDLIRSGDYARDLYTLSQETYGTSKYASLIAALNGVANRGNFNPKNLYLPSANDIQVYYESDTYTYDKTGYYVVRRGDTFKSISELVYEDAQYAEYIKTVNGLDKLVPGTMIFIPELDMEYTK